MVVAGHEDRDPLALAPVANVPVHREGIRDLAREARLEPAAGSSAPDPVGARACGASYGGPSSSSRTSSVRMKKRPPLGSDEYWWDETMFAPCSNRNLETAATIPGRSAQPISSRAE